MDRDNARSSLNLLYEVSHEVASQLDLNIVLHRMLALSMKYIGASSGSIIVLDAAGLPAETAFLMTGKQPDQTEIHLRETFENGLAGWVAKNFEAVIIPDTSKDQRWLHRPDDDEERTGPKSAVSVPIGAQDHITGVVTLVHSSPGVFNQDHLDLIRAIADQALTAIRNAQMYKSLQAAHKRYRDLFEDSIDPIIITDRKGQIIEVNRQAELTLAKQSDNLENLHITSFLQKGWGEDKPVGKLLDTRETVFFESKLLIKNHVSDAKRQIPVQVYVRSFQVEAEQQIQWIIRDISERKELDSLRDDLIAMVFHDLRSPLTNIVSSLNVISAMNYEENKETFNSLLDVAMRSTERVQRLTESLLDLSRLEVGQPIGNREWTNPVDLVRQAIEAIQPALLARQLKLLTQIPQDLPDIFIDVDMIRRVIINLLENAIKFSPSMGDILFQVKRDGNFVEFKVEDNGPGIHPEDHEHIFNKYTRVRTHNKPRGLGLGLAFCRLAVTGHDGQIWLESEVEKGSRFFFKLPIKI
jgi:two-component system, NtrC family, sensor histidine kinase KinB